MKINEIFRSISGESKFAGAPAIFIRTFGCNLLCSFCDSLYAVQGADYKEMSIDDIMKEISQYDCKRIILTGGEPLIQQDSTDLISTLLENDYFVEIETNGAVNLEPYIDKFGDNENLLYTMDWKCPSSNMNSKMLANNLELLGSEDVVKCVVGSQEDLNEMERIVKQTEAQVFVSPVFGKIDPKDIVQYVLDNNLNTVRCQLQLHKYIWPVDMRGV